MYANGTTVDGTLILKPESLDGKGEVNMADARITSETFSFGSTTIDADTSDYYLKALRGDGYGFVANNAKTHVRLHRAALFVQPQYGLIICCLSGARVHLKDDKL